jgi:hypothetical protein
MPSQGVVSGKKTSYHPGLSPIEGQRFDPIAQAPYGSPARGVPLQVPFPELLWRDTPPLEPPTTTPQSPRQMSPLRVAHSNWAPQERCPSPESFLSTPKGPPARKPSFLKSPLYTTPPPGSPIGAPIERDAHLQSPFYQPLKGPLQESPPFSKVPVIQALLQVPQSEPLLKEMPISRVLSTNP